jgi:pyruvate kinase
LTNRSRLLNSRTKTVATIGPACANQEKLAELIECGVDVFRLNMAHGSREEHEQAIRDIRAASAKTGYPTAILIDLAGPKIRLGNLFDDPVNLSNGDAVKFVRGEVSNAVDELTCLYQPLIDEVSVGDTIVLADGFVRLEVTRKAPNELDCVVVDGGEVRSRQGINLPGTDLSIAALGVRDIENAVWSCGQDVDYVSLSFVRNAEEVRQLRQILKENGSTADIIAKIEKKDALENLNEIVDEADAIMVARGDLGLEIDIEKTPAAQKHIIRTCLQYRKPVIVATQMLESMHHSKQPTRAEVTDVANAILDGADACMLSGETAIGEYPADAVKMMNRIKIESAKAFEGRSSRVTAHDRDAIWEITDAVIYGAAQIARRIRAKMVVIASAHGKAARYKSKQRDYIPTVCVTDRPRTLRKMCLYWGVVPVLCPTAIEETSLEKFVNKWAFQHTDLQHNDSYVIVSDTEVLQGIHDCVLVARLHAK